MNEVEAQEVFREFSREFLAMVIAVEQLEAIKPAHVQLLNLHVRAVGYSRGPLTYFDRDTAAVAQLIIGNVRESAKHRRDADDWFKTVVGMRDQFAKELLQVRLRYRPLYDWLELPEEILEGGDYASGDETRFFWSYSYSKSKCMDCNPARERGRSRS